MIDTISEVYDFQQNEHIIGWNASTWSYNDDYSSTTAVLIYNTKTTKIKLIFVNFHEKYGLGKGTWLTLLSVNNVGVFKKLQRTKIRELLKEHKNYNIPFTQKGWNDHKQKTHSLRMNQLFENNLKFQRIIKINNLIKTNSRC